MAEHEHYFIPVVTKYVTESKHEIAAGVSREVFRVEHYENCAVCRVCGTFVPLNLVTVTAASQENKEAVHG